MDNYVINRDAYARCARCRYGLCTYDKCTSNRRRRCRQHKHITKCVHKPAAIYDRVAHSMKINKHSKDTRRFIYVAVSHSIESFRYSLCDTNYTTDLVFFFFFCSNQRDMRHGNKKKWLSHRLRGSNRLPIRIGKYVRWDVLPWDST